MNTSTKCCEKCAGKQYVRDEQATKSFGRPMGTVEDVCLYPSCTCHSRSEEKTATEIAVDEKNEIAKQQMSRRSKDLPPEEEIRKIYEPLMNSSEAIKLVEEWIIPEIKSLLQKTRTETAERVVGYISDRVHYKEYIGRMTLMELLEEARNI